MEGLQEICPVLHLHDLHHEGDQQKISDGLRRNHDQCIAGEISLSMEDPHGMSHAYGYPQHDGLGNNAKAGDKRHVHKIPYRVFPQYRRTHLAVGRPLLVLRNRIGNFHLGGVSDTA